MMRSTFHHLAVALFLLAAPAGAQLDDYLLTAAENNPGLKADFADYLAAVEKVPQVGTLPDPMAAFGYFASPTETRVGPTEAKLALSQRFPWFGLLDAREDVAAARADSLLERFEENKSRLFYDVKRTYYDLYFVRSSIVTTNENLEILRTFQQLALIKLEAGQVSAVDELRVEMDIADLENELAFLEDRSYEIRVQFNELLNVDAEREVVTPDVLEDVGLGEDRVALFAEILDGNHSLRQLEHRILSWQHQERVAEKEGKVDFDIGLDYTFVGKSSMSLPRPSESGQDAIVFPRIGVSIPLYRKKYRAMVAEASQKLSATSFEQSERRNELRRLFERGYREYRDGARRIELYVAQSEIANQALDLLLAEYSTEGSNFEEVLRMERRVLGYDLALERARADKSSAKAFVDFLLGQ